MGIERDKFKKFLNQVDLLSTVHDVWHLGFQDTNFCAFVCEDKVGLYLKFCRDNPSYHVLSRSGDMYFNKYIPKMEKYFLGKGDSNPEIVGIVNLNMSKNESLEFENSKFLASFLEAQRTGNLPSFKELFPKKVIN
jgi:hypothetical protein